MPCRAPGHFRRRSRDARSCVGYTVGGSLAWTRRKGRSINSPETPDVTPGWYTDPWNPEQIRYFDGRQWTGEVSARRRDLTLDIDGQTSGYPLGQRVLCLSPVVATSDGDVSCAVQDANGQRLALIDACTRVPAIVGRNSRTLRFEVVLNNGVSIFSITRLGVHGNQRVLLQDPRENDLGQLRQTSSYGTDFRTGRVAMDVVSGSLCVARTEFSINPNDSFDTSQQRIYDSTGGPIAVLSRFRRDTSPERNVFDYSLESLLVTAHPLPSLLFTVAFTCYLFDRLAYRGVIDKIGYWVSRPSWHQEP